VATLPRHSVKLECSHSSSHWYCLCHGLFVYVFEMVVFSKKPYYKVFSVIISEIVCMVSNIVATSLAKMVCGNREYEDSDMQLNWVYIPTGSPVNK
jgi:hypothetical protein